MSSDTRWRLLLPSGIRKFPADLAAVIGAVCLTVVVVFVPGVRETPLRIVFGLPFVLFIPGYALIAALFPERGEAPAAEEDSETNRTGIDGIERVALSFGLSIAVVPLIGLVLNFTPWGIRLVPIVISVSGFTLVMTAAAAKRRWKLPVDERFQVPYSEWVSSVRSELFEPETRTDSALNLLLVVSLLLAVASVGYAVTVPKQGESFTEFYLLTENEDGELVADGYPTNFTVGEGQSLVVGIGNQEHEAVNYTVVVELQRVRIVNDTNETAVQVLEERNLRRFQTRLGHNETWHSQHTLTPTMTGKRLRVEYLLYRGEVPADPSTSSAYREVHLWVNVSSS